jgi:hypothetical protein
MGAGKELKSFKIEFKDSNIPDIDIQALLANRLLGADDAPRAAIMAEVMESGARRLGLELELRRTSRYVNNRLKESRKIVGEHGENPAGLKKHLEDGGSMPDMLHVGPERLQGVFTGDDSISKRAFRALDRYVEVGKEAGKMLGVAGDSVWVPKSLASTLTWKAKTMRMLFDDDIAVRINRVIKANFTARRAITHLHNISANLLYQAMRLADPLTFLKMIPRTADYLLWKKGYGNKKVAGLALVNKKNIPAYEALERTGKMGVTDVDAEYGMMAGAGTRREVLGKLPVEAERFLDVIGKYPKKWNRFADITYKWGDNILKLDEYMRNWRKHDKWLSGMADGDRIQFEAGPKRFVTLEKRGGKLYLPDSDKPIKKSKLEDIKAHSSINPALNIFHDYEDIPNLATTVRWIPGTEGFKGAAAIDGVARSITSIASPFFIWFYKSADVPGLKQGLVSRAFQPGPYVKTTSKNVSKMLRREALGTLFRVQAMMATAKAMASDPDLAPESARLIYSYRSNRMALEDLALKTTPAFVGRRSFEATNTFEPSMLVLSLFQAGAESMGLIEPSMDLESLYPPGIDNKGVLPPHRSKVQGEYLDLMRKQFWRIKAGRRGVSFDDAMKLGGLGGSMFMEVYTSFDSRRTDKWYKVAQTFAQAALGGTLGAMSDVFITGVARTPKQKERIGEWAMAIDPNSVDALMEGEFVRSGVRHILGITWPPWGDKGDVRNLAKDTKNYFKGMRAELTKTMVSPIEKEAELAQKTDPQKYRALMGRATNIRRAIKQEIGRIEKETINDIVTWASHGAFTGSVVEGAVLDFGKGKRYVIKGKKPPPTLFRKARGRGRR